MATPLLARRRILALATETTMGTAVALTNSNAGFKVQDRSLKIVRETTQRERQGSGGQDIGVAGAAHTELTFTTFLHGSGGSNAAALALVIFPSMGMPVTTATFNESWDTSTWKSLSAGSYIDGVKVLGRGIMGNAKITMTPGEMWQLEYTGQGGYVANPTDASLLTSVTYESVTPPIWVPGAGNALTIDSQTIFKPSKVEVDFGRTVSLREDPNSAGGYCSAFIEKAEPKITMDAETFLRASYDINTKHSGNSTFAFSAVLDGSTGNTITLTATVQVGSAPEWTERNGKLADNVTLNIVNDSLAVAYS